jgi:predicted ester cyclase
MGTIRDIADRDIRAYNTRDDALVVADVTDDIEVAVTGNMTLRGKSELVQFNKNWQEAFPDSKLTARAVHDAGTVGIIEGTFTGTQTGVFHTPMGDIPPTNKSVSGEYIQVFELRGDKVAKGRLLFDRMDLMEQLGLVPAAAGAATS